MFRLQAQASSGQHKQKKTHAGFNLTQQMAENLDKNDNI